MHLIWTSASLFLSNISDTVPPENCTCIDGGEYFPARCGDWFGDSGMDWCYVLDDTCSFKHPSRFGLFWAHCERRSKLEI